MTITKTISMIILFILFITIFLLLLFSSIIHLQWTCTEWDALYRDLPNRQMKVKVSEILITFSYLVTEMILKIQKPLCNKTCPVLLQELKPNHTHLVSCPAAHANSF